MQVDVGWPSLYFISISHASLIINIDLQRDGLFRKSCNYLFIFKCSRIEHLTWRAVVAVKVQQNRLAGKR
jgi:hypothetical protein